MSASDYPLLFSPTNIGKVQLKNRIVKTAAQTYFFESGENRVGTLAKAFYGAVARGGAGLIITETPAMEWPLLEEGDRRFRIDNDKYIPNLAELSAEVHKYGVPDLHPALPPRPLERHLRPHRRADSRLGGHLSLAVRRSR